MTGREFLVFDVETTGLHDACQLVEFAAIALDPSLRAIARYETLIQPVGRPGPTRIHGITSEMLQVAPTFDRVAGDVERMFRDRIPVAHNLRFDWGVLRRAYASLDVEAPPAPGGICTARMSERVLGSRRRLVEVCRRLGIDYGSPHRAGADAEAAAAVLRVLQRDHPDLVFGRPCSVFHGAWRLARSVPACPRDATEGLGVGRGSAPARGAS